MFIDSLKTVLKQYHDRIGALEDEKYDMEYIVKRKDAEVVLSLQKKKQNHTTSILHTFHSHVNVFIPQAGLIGQLFIRCVVVLCVSTDDRSAAARCYPPSIACSAIISLVLPSTGLHIFHHRLGLA